MNTEEKYALAYIRVSTQYQVNDGVSIDMQKDKIQKYCTYQRMKIKNFYVDEDVSGKSMKNRVELHKCLNDLTKGDTLIVYSISRLARSLKDMMDMFHTINSRGCFIVSTTEQFDTNSAAGKLFFQVIGAFAEYESNLDSERVKHAMAEKKSRGEHQGKPRYGWKLKSVKGSGLIPDQYEQKIIRLMLNLKFRKTLDNKEWSYQDVTNQLNVIGIKPRSGNYWMKSSVHAIITGIGKDVATKGRNYRQVDERRKYVRTTEKNINKDIITIDEKNADYISSVDIEEMEEIKKLVSSKMSQPPKVKYVEDENGDKIMEIIECRKEIERKKLVNQQINKLRTDIRRCKDSFKKSHMLKKLKDLSESLEDVVYTEDEYVIDDYGKIDI